MAEESGREDLMALLMAVAREDRQAFERLYVQVSGQMFALCRRLTGQQELAEEALQDTFIRIWHHAGEYHSDRGSPLSWMFTIARYRTLDLMRARKVRQADGEEALSTVADSRPGPLDVSLREDGSLALSGCLEELSNDQRDSILLSYFRGLTHDELSTTLRTPVGTVKSWIRRGLIALKRCLTR